MREKGSVENIKEERKCMIQGEGRREERSEGEKRKQKRARERAKIV